MSKATSAAASIISLFPAPPDMTAPTSVSSVPGPNAEHLPSVDRVLNLPAVAELLPRYGRPAVTQAVREHLQALRQNRRPPDMQQTSLAQGVATRLTQSHAPRLKTVFNLTGTVLHTNLGRALLPDEAIVAVTSALRAPCNIEYDLKNGALGERDALVENLLCELTGAEAAAVVNNNDFNRFRIIHALAGRNGVKNRVA